ncbi:unnamed protein product [Dicrocoelium dendriticum]|nr:unnamed protein product [Dicrocoelium dendriticum]
MTEKDLDFRIWQTKLYILQRDAPTPHMIACTKELAYRPPQYGLEYHGPISRMETERLMEDAPDGAYLIRESQRAPNSYTLVIRFDNVARNYMLFYDAEKQQHYVGEKCFDTVEMLVADGLIHFNVETRGADVLRKMAEANTYEKTPFYRMRYHTFNVGEPNHHFERMLNKCIGIQNKSLHTNDSASPRVRVLGSPASDVPSVTTPSLDYFQPDTSHPSQQIRDDDVDSSTPSSCDELDESPVNALPTETTLGHRPYRTRPPPSAVQVGVVWRADQRTNSADLVDSLNQMEPPVPPVRSTSGSHAKHYLLTSTTDNAPGQPQDGLTTVTGRMPIPGNTDPVSSIPPKTFNSFTFSELKPGIPTSSTALLSEFSSSSATHVVVASSDDAVSLLSKSEASSSTVSPGSTPERHPCFTNKNGIHLPVSSSELLGTLPNAPEYKDDDSRAVINLMERYRLPTVCLAADQTLPTDTERRKHNFKVHTYRGPHWCDFCTHFIWGLVAQGVKCADCGFQAHKRCSDLVPDDCLPDIKQMKRVFGVDLIGLTLAERKPIPTILERCVEEIERRGALESEGLYRVPGNHDRIEQARSAFDKNSETAVLSPSRIPDVNVITSLIKAFLRQLPVPLITYEAYPKLMDIIRDSQLNEAEKLVEISIVLSTLPAAHYESLRFFLRHIHRVACNHKKNMMSVQNLAVVLAPSLMSSSYSDPLSCLTGMKFEHALMELLIREYIRLFPPFDRFNRRSSALDCHSQPTPHPTPDRPTSQWIQFIPSSESIPAAVGQVKRRFVKHRRSIDTGLLTSQTVTSGVSNATPKPFSPVNTKF